LSFFHRAATFAEGVFGLLAFVPRSATEAPHLKRLEELAGVFDWNRRPAVSPGPASSLVSVRSREGRWAFHAHPAVFYRPV
jgi:hypothetical protein